MPCGKTGVLDSCVLRVGALGCTGATGGCFSGATGAGSGASIQCGTLAKALPITGYCRVLLFASFADCFCIACRLL